MNEYNLIHLENPEDIKAIFEGDIGDRKFRLMLTGYSAAPAGYEARAYDFVCSLVRKLNPENTALITSPTADKGSIDAIGTMVAQVTGAKIMHITSQDYVKYIDPTKFPESLDTAAYSSHPKYVLPDNAKYSLASTMASTAILVTGGRDTAVKDTINSLLQKNRVIVAENLTDTLAWDNEKARINNAAAYMREQINSLCETGELKYPAKGGLTKEFLLQHQNEIQFVSTSQEAALALTQQDGRGDATHHVSQGVLLKKGPAF